MVVIDGKWSILVIGKMYSMYECEGITAGRHLSFWNECAGEPLLPRAKISYFRNFLRNYEKFK